VFPICSIYTRRNAAMSIKKAAAMRRIVLVSCVLIFIRPNARAEPSPTPSHIVSRIPRQRVESSAIAKIGCSKRRHILEIEFIDGAIYRYLEVPVAVYRELMSAESKARFYDSSIKKHYRSVLVRSRQKQERPEKSPAPAQDDRAASHK
jgi:KTSC domain